MGLGQKQGHWGRHNSRSPTKSHLPGHKKDARAGQGSPVHNYYIRRVRGKTLFFDGESVSFVPRTSPA